MKKTSWIACAVLLFAGCGQAPPPTGPAAEATTPEIEVSMPDATEAPATSNQTQPSADDSTKVSFNVPGMS